MPALTGRSRPPDERVAGSECGLSTILVELVRLRPEGARMPAARLPDFVIAGAPKAGTTALHAALATHPQLYLSPVKEP